jgi:hypothetical protein
MVRTRWVLLNRAFKAGMLAHQMPMLISIMDQVFMGTEAWKGSGDCSITYQHKGRGNAIVRI